MSSRTLRREPRSFPKTPTIACIDDQSKGRVYEDFDNHRLYEVIYIYYDNREQRVCGYSRSMDDAPADPQDVFPISCEGPECLEEMVRDFESILIGQLHRMNLSSINYETQY